MPKIVDLKAREILDSRGIPTLEAKITLDTGQTAITAVPSGISTGKYEVVELRDNDKNRYQGNGVLKAVNVVNQTLFPQIKDKDPTNQEEIDRLLIELDGTETKNKLGGNSILVVSQATAKAAALANNLPLYQYVFEKFKLTEKIDTIPTPQFNVINGGKHGAGNLDFQEFHVIPSIRKKYHQALQIGQEIYKSLEQVLIYRGAIHSVGVEGGFAPNLFTNSDALEIIMEAISQSNCYFGQDVFIGLDVAASNFYQNGQYFIKDRPQAYTRNDLIHFYEELNNQYHLYSLEDPLQEDDWETWTQLTATIGYNTVLVGDDLLTTNKEKVKKAIEQKACTAILIKPNQIGTLSETVAVIKLARDAGWQIIVSHRSGESNDDFIADFAVGVGADYVKFGAPARGERVAKYNRLLSIESELFPYVETEPSPNQPPKKQTTSG